MAEAKSLSLIKPADITGRSHSPLRSSWSDCQWCRKPFDLQEWPGSLSWLLSLRPFPAGPGDLNVSIEFIDAKTEEGSQASSGAEVNPEKSTSDEFDQVGNRVKVPVFAFSLVVGTMPRQRQQSFHLV